MIVIDVGCGKYGGDYSIERLLTEYTPDILYAFDPNESGLRAAVDAASEHTRRRGSQVYFDNVAAWMFDGEVGFREDGLNSWVSDDPTAPKVRCIDLARFIEDLPEDDIVLKLDCEGAEYDLLADLILKGADRCLTLALVEWHTKGVKNAESRRRVIEKEFFCPIKEWPY